MLVIAQEKVAQEEVTRTRPLIEQQIAIASEANGAVDSF